MCASVVGEIDEGRWLALSSWPLLYNVDPRTRQQTPCGREKRPSGTLSHTVIFPYMRAPTLLDRAHCTSFEINCKMANRYRGDDTLLLVVPVVQNQSLTICNLHKERLQASIEGIFYLTKRKNHLQIKAMNPNSFSNSWSNGLNLTWSHPSVLNSVRIPSARVMESLNFLFSNSNGFMRTNCFPNYR